MLKDALVRLAAASMLGATFEAVATGTKLLGPSTTIGIGLAHEPNGVFSASGTHLCLPLYA